MKRIIYALLLSFVCLPFLANGSEADSVRVYVPNSDNPTVVAGTEIIPTDSTKVKKKKAKKPKKDKKFDFIFAGAPSYSKTTSLMLSVCGSGEYRFDRRDTLIEKSNVSIYANASLNGVLTLGVMGKNFLPQDKARLNYDLFVQRTKARTWGIGIEDANRDDNETNFDRLQLKFEPEFIYKVAKGFYAGVTINLERNNMWKLTNINQQWLKDAEVADPEVKKLEFFNEKGELQNLHYFDHHIQAFGFGYTLNYDTRDFIRNASKGINIRWSQMFYLNKLVGGKMKYDVPEAIKNVAAHSGFFTSDLTFNVYTTLWKDAILAYELHGRYNSGKDVPWVMMSEVGGSSRMRGYFLGRYRDKGLIETQIELRQHIWWRFGAVAWFGAANVFPKFNEIRLKESLLNAGVGLRFAFKPRINIRADFGFGKNGLGIVFGINEAF